jgi:hypothetical protein
MLLIETVDFINVSHPKRPHVSLSNVLANGRACHMLVSVPLLGKNLNIYAKLENFGHQRT